MGHTHTHGALHHFIAGFVVASIYFVLMLLLVPRF